jgi:transcription initiation factor TFIIA large subunit
LISLYFFELSGGTAGAQLQTILSSPAVTAALSLPVEMATTVLQQHINNALQVYTIR